MNVVRCVRVHSLKKDLDLFPEPHASQKPERTPWRLPGMFPMYKPSHKIVCYQIARYKRIVVAARRKIEDLEAALEKGHFFDEEDDARDF
jgi:hypothetical protein